MSEPRVGQPEAKAGHPLEARSLLEGRFLEWPKRPTLRVPGLADSQLPQSRSGTSSQGHPLDIHQLNSRANSTAGDSRMTLPCHQIHTTAVVRQSRLLPCSPTSHFSLGTWTKFTATNTAGQSVEMFKSVRSQVFRGGMRDKWPPQPLCQDIQLCSRNSSGKTNQQQQKILSMDS